LARHHEVITCHRAPRDPSVPRGAMDLLGRKQIDSESGYPHIDAVARELRAHLYLRVDLRLAAHEADAGNDLAPAGGGGRRAFDRGRRNPRPGWDTAATASPVMLNARICVAARERGLRRTGHIRETEHPRPEGAAEMRGGRWPAAANRLRAR